MYLIMHRILFDGILIVSVTPYFIDRGYFWFEKNLQKILRASKNQSWWQDNVLFLEKKQTHPLAQLLRKLDALGYEKVQTIENPGEFSHRGGIVDIFPINPVRSITVDSPKQNSAAKNSGRKKTETSNGVNCLGAVRLEFFGNQIENIIQLENISIANEEEFKKRLKRKLRIQKKYSDLSNLKPGEYVVHLDHGIARFAGTITAENTNENVNKDASTNQNFGNCTQRPLCTVTNSGYKQIGPGSGYYALEYAQNDKLFVPVGLERKLSRYVGFEEPKIHRLGGTFWHNTKKKIKAEIEKLAKELLELYAKREITSRQPYIEDEEIEREIESSFKYVETPDQQRAIEEIKKDLQKIERPMDRIVCGEVGFGKTEVALRSAVIAAASGKQAAILAPTTILCRQHYLNFKERLRNLAIEVSEISRLESQKEQKEIIKNLEAGKIDIILGTHRLLSSDIKFKDLGLLIVDEEQRFGVRQKEKLKKMRESLDILSLSATPIPRTLYLTLSGLRTISQIQTPPPERLAIKTFVLPFSEKIIKRAIQKEIGRGGQVYYLHNRIETMETAKKFLENLMSGARVGVAHGRMPERKLTQIMEDFQNNKFKILCATTIIENGLDITNVNTLIVADATKLGLAEAHQIRGRIGRSHIQAYAYFLYGENLTAQAKTRLEYLKEYQHLGAGYQIAVKDLEMRGAGNILGKEQSGSINQVGLNLYCQMLSEAVEKFKTARPAP